MSAPSTDETASNSTLSPSTQRHLEVVIEDILRFDPVRSSAVGHTAQDGLFADFSEAGRYARRRTLANHIQSMESFSQAKGPYDADRRLLIDDLKIALRTEADLDPTRRNPALYVYEVLHGISLLTMRPPLHLRLGGLLSRLRQVARVFGQAREELDPTEVPLIFCETAIQAARAGLLLLTETLPAQVAAALPDNPICSAVAAASGEAALALSAYANFLEEAIAPAAAGDFAVGNSYFKFLVNKRLSALPNFAGPVDINELAAQAEDTIRDLNQRMPPGWRERLQQVDDQEAMPALDNVEVCRSLCERAREALRQSGAFPLSLLSEERLFVQTTPAYARILYPFSAYFGPPTLGPREPEVLNGVLWITPGVFHGERGLFLSCLLSAYPGGHFQACHALRNPSPVRRLLASVSPVTSGGGYAASAAADAFAQGFAYSCGSLLSELGLSDEVLTLHRMRNELFAAHKVLIDIGLHTLGMTKEEAVDNLVRGVSMRAKQAEAEVRRYAQNPTSALSAYLIGREIAASRARNVGARMSLAEFHTQVLQGDVPA